MSKVRINDLAREMEIKRRHVLDIFAEFGLGAGKTHSSSLDEDQADKVRAQFPRGSRHASTATTPASRAPQAIAPKIDLSHISKPGDVLKAIQAKKQEEEAEARKSRLPLKRAAVEPEKAPARPAPPVAVRPPAAPAKPETRKIVPQPRSAPPIQSGGCQGSGRRRAASGRRRDAAHSGRGGQAAGQTPGCSS